MDLNKILAIYRERHPNEPLPLELKSYDHLIKYVLIPKRFDKLKDPHRLEAIAFWVMSGEDLRSHPVSRQTLGIIKDLQSVGELGKANCQAIAIKWGVSSAWVRKVRSRTKKR